MTFQSEVRTLAESRFLELGPTLTLYHGSSSGKLQRFQTEGVPLPRGSHRGHLFDTAQNLWAEWAPKASSEADPYNLPGWVVRKLEGYYEKRASLSVPDDSKGYIYTTYKFKVAEDYARKYALNGSELTGKAYWFIGNYLRDTYGYEMPDRFEGGSPIVLVLEVDWDWVIVPLETQGSFREYVQQIVSRETKKGLSLDQIEARYFPHNDWQTEVLVTRDIPPSRIVEIVTL